jgi:ABC-type multidrug transport system fused ATPase/permease subunit
MYFENRTHRHSWQFKWHALFAFIILLAACLLLAGMILGGSSSPPNELGSRFISAGKMLLGTGGFYAVFAALLLFYEIVHSLKRNSEQLDNTLETLSRQNNLLVRISQASHLSDTAKEIVFRDSEQMELGEAALTKLHQHDFDEAESMINTMSEYPKYKELASRLKRMAEKYRNATEEGRVNQIIAHIEGLFDQKLWIQAAAQIENLLKTFSYSDKAKAMPSRLRERKDRQKRELLADWDLAVREKNTDRGLEILKELDLYLSPNEALALRESASTVFKSKLHNLGVEFSVSVAEKNWKKALETGRDIVQNFPNSRMAAEIRSKLDILSERAKKTAS